MITRNFDPEKEEEVALVLRNSLDKCLIIDKETHTFKKERNVPFIYLFGGGSLQIRLDTFLYVLVVCFME